MRSTSLPTETGTIEFSLFRTRPESPGAQTVTYFVRSEELVRTVSIEDEDTTTSVTMLGDVREFRVRLLLSGNWVAPNELDESVTGRAQAIEVAIERAAGECYLRILPL